MADIADWTDEEQKHENLLNKHTNWPNFELQSKELSFGPKPTVYATMRETAQRWDRFRFRFICIVARRLKITENEKKQFTTNKVIDQKKLSTRLKDTSYKERW